MADYHSTYCIITEKECGCGDCSICGTASKYERENGINDE
jgi:hypothetical protein